MKAKATYLFIVFILLFSGISLKSFAQPYLGIVWDTPNGITESREDLNAFAALGITHLEMSYPVPPPILEQLSEYDFTVMVRTQYEYLILSELEETREEMIQRYSDMLSSLHAYPYIKYLGLFSNSESKHTGFQQALEPVLDTLSNTSNLLLYEYAGDQWMRLPEQEEPLGVLFNDYDYETADIIAFDQQFKKLIALDSREILFMRSDWFLEAISSYNPFTESLANFNEDGIWKIPLPENTNKGVSANWLVLLLLSFWIMLAIQVKYLPYIRPMIVRYFLSHRFYVDDILQYRERAATGGILMMILHSVFSGVVGYITAMLLMTDAGMQAFFHHLPFLALTGTNFVSFFFIALVLSLLTQLIALFWIYLPAKKLDHISQCINLYSGVLYLDFLIVTLMVTLYVSGIGATLNLVLAVFFVIIWYNAFNLAAMDASRGMGQRKVTYLLLTVGLHTLISGAVVLTLLSDDSWFQILDLAVSLP